MTSSLHGYKQALQATSLNSSGEKAYVQRGNKNPLRATSAGNLKTKQPNKRSLHKFDPLLFSLAFWNELYLYVAHW